LARIIESSRYRINTDTPTKTETIQLPQEYKPL